MWRDNLYKSKTLMKFNEVCNVILHLISTLQWIAFLLKLVEIGYIIPIITIPAMLCQSSMTSPEYKRKCSLTF